MWAFLNRIRTIATTKFSTVAISNIFKLILRTMVRLILWKCGKMKMYLGDSPTHRLTRIPQMNLIQSGGGKPKLFQSKSIFRFLTPQYVYWPMNVRFQKCSETCKNSVCSFGLGFSQIMKFTDGIQVKLNRIWDAPTFHSNISALTIINNLMRI